jgi:serpin B
MKMMKRGQQVAGGLILAAALGGCAGTNNGLGATSSYGGDTLGMQQNQFQQQAVSTATKALKSGDAPLITSGENQLGFSLFDKLVKADAAKNVCVSPVSVGSVLGILYNGSGGDTRKQIGQALNVGKLSLDQINDANKNLQSVLSNVDPNKVELNIANSVWVDAGTPLSTDFVQKDQQYYTAKVSTLDFKAPESPSTINDWVKTTTKGKIPTIVDSIPPDARLYVVNAVYFNGTWQKPFDTNKTQPQTFSMVDGTQEQTPMMTQSGSFPYFIASDATGVVLPYGSGRLEMDVILPNGQDIAAFEKKLTPALFSSWVKAEKPTAIQVTVPTFQFDYASSLNDSLKADGITAAFDPTKADFSAMQDKSASSSQRLYLSEVKHKTFIDVNERGTEAAAATSAQINATATMLPGVRFTADHPFLYVIRDSITGSILFVGVVMDPKASPATGTKTAQGAIPAPLGKTAGT